MKKRSFDVESPQVIIKGGDESKKYKETFRLCRGGICRHIETIYPLITTEDESTFPLIDGSIISFILDIPDNHKVTDKVRRNTSRVTARWKNDTVVFPAFVLIIKR
jgi:hypothetical protein